MFAVSSGPIDHSMLRLLSPFCLIGAAFLLPFGSLVFCGSWTVGCILSVCVEVDSCGCRTCSVLYEFCVDGYYCLLLGACVC